MMRRRGLPGLPWRRFVPGGPARDPESRRASEQEGRLAEHTAAWWLRLKGYRILGSRVRTPVGEIDLIVQRGPTTCFVEVKQRRSLEAALHAVTPTQRERIARAAEWWITQPTSVQTPEKRFDVVAIVPGKRPHHLPDAWRRDQP